MLVSFRLCGESSSSVIPGAYPQFLAHSWTQLTRHAFQRIRMRRPRREESPNGAVRRMPLCDDKVGKVESGR